MTVKELYELAKLSGCEDKEILVKYICNDDLYSFDSEPFSNTDVTMSKECGVEIHIIKL